MDGLSKPQRMLLAEIEHEPLAVAHSYQPARKLVELGLATWRVLPHSAPLTITEAGRVALAAQS